MSSSESLELISMTLFYDVTNKYAFFGISFIDQIVCVALIHGVHFLQDNEVPLAFGLVFSHS